MRPRQIAPVALVLGLTVAGFFLARLLGQRDALRDAQHRAEVAAAQIRGRFEQGASLADSLRRFMAGVGGSGVTSEEFATNTSRWLTPAGFPAAAWVERVPASGRQTYERRSGHPIVTEDRGGGIVPAGTRPSYLPATLVSGIPPMTVPGIDLGSEPGMTRALSRADRLYDAGATPLATLPDGSRGLFLVEVAPRFTGGVLEPGYVVVFVPELGLRAAATDSPRLQLTVGGASTGGPAYAAPVRTRFTEAGQRFEIGVARSPVQGAATVLPWIILAAGLVLAALAGALGVNAGRRARAQRELDRIFTLSSDLIVVADFEGHLTRVNPAAERVLGYTRDELLARPYLDLVHPEDRDGTAAAAAALSKGERVLSFENRYIRKDGSPRVLEWTSTPDVQERLTYAVGRDVTGRREAAAELERLAGEQAALRRVATLVARGVPPEEVFAAVTGEIARFLALGIAYMGRLEPDGSLTVIASSGVADDVTPLGGGWTLGGKNVATMVANTGRAARIDRYGTDTSGAVGAAGRQAGFRSAVGAPVIVEGRLWGVIAAGSPVDEPLPADIEERLTSFTELLATAIANAESRAALAASRARIVAAADESRRRIQRDLHDGAQQRLVHAVIVLKLAVRALESGDADAGALVAEALRHAEQTNSELRELAHGILPAALSRGGLRAGIGALVSRVSLPVTAEISVPRLPRAVEATAYFIVSEALTNVIKHARADQASVIVRADNNTLRVEIRDDGIGGADPRKGSGLIGLSDRIEALGGRLELTSTAGSGTTLRIEIPLRGDSSEGAREPLDGSLGQSPTRAT